MSYPQTNLTGLIGFAKVAGVTGGTGGTVVTVKSLTELQSAVSGSAKKIVVLAASLSSSTLRKVTFGSNKTIVGSFGGANVLNNIHLRATSSSSNIIFQNLTFKHDVSIKANDDIQLYLNYGKGYWVDHCSWPGHTWSDTDGSLDKLIYVGDKADYVTISNCYFSNHKYGCIFGHPADDNNTSYNGYPHLTICHNRYENIEVRCPGLMRYGYFHVFNNYVNKFQLAFTVAQNANILSEKNVFGSGAEKGGIVDDKGNGSTFTDNGSSPTATASKSSAAKWAASSNYSYKLMSVSEAKSWAVAYSGAQNSALTFPA
ncbi:pectate lyase [Brenneria populi]|uniref:Pectate lyase n=1 Tax=Brenneria populi TaxID=1505588 RepID=A0ABU6JUB3_9GAMM|nr:pectate lyase [Brenneria populi Li et al. 2015]